ncbi:hypothetical protein FRC05_006187 [Tulasnella sp. 425]|nr:hypothetical protein FRC05_006187 [Tulasnella sp. 425]
MECSYKHTTSASTKAELLQDYNEYVDACKDYGYPIQGDTSIDGAPIVQGSSSSSATAAASSSTASTKSASNGANVLSSGLVSGVALPLAAIAVSALVL